MRVFISGPITGVPDYEIKFKRVQNNLEAYGFDVINPAELPKCIPNAEWGDYMEITLMLLDKADMLVSLDGWEESKGARIERKVALMTDKEVVDYDQIKENIFKGVYRDAVKKK